MSRTSFSLVLGCFLWGTAVWTSESFARSPFSLVRFTRSEEVAKSSRVVTEQNGPWMIFVASFAGEGAEEDARRLMQELRSEFGLDAYVHKKKFDFSNPVEGKGFDMYGNPKKMKFQIDQAFEEVAVLVGDYPAVDDSQLRKDIETLKYAQPNALKGENAKPVSTLRFAGLRNFHRRLLKGENENQAKGPLARAFATRNPLLPDGSLETQGLDPLVVEMNKNRKFSLLENPGKYTIRVASYRGEVIIDQNKVQRASESKASFKSKLDEAGEKAEKLTRVLREKGVDAYVFHDRHESIVAVGSFAEIGQAQADGRIELQPAVAKIMEKYGPAKKPVTGKNGVALTGFQPKTLAGMAFDIAPQPILVPRRSIGNDYLSVNR